MQPLIHNKRILAGRGFFYLTGNFLCCLRHFFIQNYTEMFGVLRIMALLYKMFVTVQFAWRY